MKRLDPVIVGLCGLLACVATWAITARSWVRELRGVKTFYEVPMAEARPYAQKYGLERSSINLEELFIRDFFQDRRHGVFVDVGANHYREHSNTYYLETALGWSGIAIEPLSEFQADYQRFRPKTRFVAAFASDVADTTVKFFVPHTDRNRVASSTAALTARETRGAPSVETTVPTTTLNAVLEEAGLTTFDFLSMDIELAEPQALKGFDIRKYQPSLVCIESHPEVRQWIIDYMHDRGYRVVGRYLRADSRNLYFTNTPVVDDPAMMGHYAH